MNNPSPFNPQSSVPEQKNQSRTRVRTAVTLVFAVNVVALLALLIIGFGCRKPAEPEVPAPDTNAMVMPAFDTNSVALPGTNAPATNAMASVPPVPEPVVTPAAGQEHVIVKGDTLAELAKTYHVSVKAIQDGNPGVDPRRLKIGQKIQIPAAAAEAVTATAGAAPVADTGSAEQTYKVKSGDTLTAIAKHLGVSVKALRSANNLTSDRIKVGDKLKVPAKASAPVVSEPSAGNPKPL